LFLAFVSHLSSFPASRECSLLADKIRANVNRASLVGKALKAQGFRVERLWEHELRPAT